MNDDIPYHEFIIEHLAGDLLEHPRLRGKQQANESILATGFWYLGDWIHSPTDIRADEMERVDNQLDVFGRSMLGITVACARCHDHKFDAISSADYYALAGYLQSSSYRQVRFESMEHNRLVAHKLWALRERTSKELRSQLGQRMLVGIAELPAYLRAAAKVLQNSEDIERFAAERQLDPARLTAWRDYLRGVQGDTNQGDTNQGDTNQGDTADWLYPWSRLPDGQGAETSFAAAWQSLVERHHVLVTDGEASQHNRVSRRWRIMTGGKTDMRSARDRSARGNCQSEAMRTIQGSRSLCAERPVRIYCGRH